MELASLSSKQWRGLEIQKNMVWLLPNSSPFLRTNTPGFYVQCPKWIEMYGVDLKTTQHDLHLKAATSGLANACV